jgi:hypothetical protein
MPHIQGQQSARMIGTLTPLGLMPMFPSTSLLPTRCDLPFDSWPKMYYSASRSERLIRPTKYYTAFNMTQGRTTNRSLNDSDGDRSTPKTSMPCCFTIVIPPGLISFYYTWFLSTIANIANCAIYEYPYILQVIGNHLTSTA